MQKTEPLKYGDFYHIYNRGINSCNLFTEQRNYGYFLKLYEKYINQIADTFAWVLMPNHFHFLVKVKDENIVASNSDRVQNPVRVGNNNLVQNPVRVGDETNPVRVNVEKGGKTGTPSQQFSKLFNAYAQAFNKQEERHGSLFERPFKRKRIDDESYLKQLILYIHNNPVHHGFCKHSEEYPWSSYHSCISKTTTKLQRETVIGWFEDLDNFKYVHNEKADMTNIDEWD